MTHIRIGVVNYGVGNLGSMLNMLRFLDLDSRTVSDADQIGTFDRLILPGVGSFDRGMKGLEADGLGDAIRQFVASGSPLMGVCLGMQLLTRGSEEGGKPGLGLVPAECTRLTPSLPDERIPHMGWNWISPTGDHPMTKELPTPAKFYFAHSYAVRCDREADVLATTDFAGGFTSIFSHGNVAGAQFHPEKSHQYGMSLIRIFAEWGP